MRPLGVLVLMALVVGFGCVSASGQTTATWTDTSGNWSTAGNWSTDPVVPHNGGGNFYNAVINGTGSDTVTFDASGTVLNSLSLGAGETLQDNGLAPSLTIGDPRFPAAGSLTNNGTIDWGNGANLVVNIIAGNGNITNNTSGTINLTNATLTFDDSGKRHTATLSGGGTINLSGAMVMGGFGDETLNNVDNTITGSGTISNLTFVNNGIINANADTSLTITPNRGGFTNNGTLNSTGQGGVVIDAAGHGPAANNGAMIIDNASSIAVNGNFSQNGSLTVGSPATSSGFFDVSGKLINSGDASIINNVGGGLEAGSIINSGSIVVGGFLSSLGTGDLKNSGSLIVSATNSVDIGGNFNNSGSFLFTGGSVEGRLGGWGVVGAFNNSGTVTVTGAFGQVGGLFKNSGNIDLSFETLSANGGFINSGGAVTVDERGILNVTNGYRQGGAGASTEVVGVLNADSYRQNGGGTTIDFGALLSSTTFKAIGGTVTVNGMLVSTAAEFDARSRLQGTGTLTGNVAIGGTITPGTVASPGTLTITGDYAQTGKGIFDEVISVTSNGLLNVNGAAALGPQSKLEITLLGGINPIGDSLTIMDYNHLAGNFLNGTAFSADGYKWKLNYGSDEILLTALSPSVTPEPGTWLLFGSGLLGILGVVRKKIIA